MYRNNPFLRLLKKAVLLTGLTAISFMVAADCAQDCQAKYDECMKISHSVGKAKICGEILNSCKLECATGGE